MSAQIESSSPFQLNSTLKELDPTKRWVVGIAIQRPPTSTTPSLNQKPRILLVKRAAHEHDFPNCWEIPGGHVEAGETVKQCVARETFEETGLRIDKVLGEFEEMRWESKKQGGKQNVQLNYAASVAQSEDEEGAKVVLNADEHSEWMWAALEDMEGLEMTDEMREVVRNGLRFFRDKGVCGDSF